MLLQTKKGTTLSLSFWKLNVIISTSFFERIPSKHCILVYIIFNGLFVKYSPIIVINSTMMNDPHPIQNIHINMVIGTQKTLSWLSQLGTVTFKIKTIGHTIISLILNSCSRSLSFHLGKIICSCTINPFAATPKDY